MNQKVIVPIFDDKGTTTILSFVFDFMHHKILHGNWEPNHRSNLYSVVQISSDADTGPVRLVAQIHRIKYF